MDPQIINIFAPQPPMHADFGIVEIIIAVGLSVASALLTKRAKTLNSTRDDTPPTLALRGSYAPLVIGKRRVAPVIAYVGHRRVSGSAQGDRYSEDAMHVLSVGPADSLTKIVQDGKIVWEGEITPGDTPSGTNVPFPHDGGGVSSYDIYWGECDQPVNSDPLRQIASAFPHFFYINWRRKFLGFSPRWPTIEYEMTCKFPGASPLAGDPWITSSGGHGAGMNAAHVLYQLCTAKYPHGCGMPAHWFDLTNFNALAALCAEEGLAMNLLCDSGMSGIQAVGSLLQDAGVMFVQDGDLLTPVIVRKVSTSGILTLDNLTIAAPLPKVDELQGDRPVDQIVYSISDQDHGYHGNTLTVYDDSQIQGGRAFSSRTVTIDTVTNYALAAVVIDRRQQEDFGNVVTLTFNGLRGIRVLRPGAVFLYGDFGLQRIMSVKLDTESGKIVLETVRDLYGIDSTDRFPDPPPLPDPPVDPASPATAFRAIEAPFGWPVASGEASQRAVMALWSPADDNIPKALIWGSQDNVTYDKEGFQPIPAITGVLSSDLGGDQFDMIIEDGPDVVLDDHGDLSAIPDLSSNQPDWLYGRTVLFVDDEICFVKSVTILSGGVIQLNGLIRGRFDTAIAAHTAGTRVFLIERQDPVLFDYAFSLVGSIMWLKAQPYSEASTPATDISLSAMDEIILKGRAALPLPPDNFAANKIHWSINRYSTGGDIVFSWTLRRIPGNSGAGDIPFGNVLVGAVSPPSFTYPVILEIYDGTSLVRRITPAVNSLATTYSNADLISDFGSEPAAFTAKLYSQFVVTGNSLVTREITITKV